MVNIHSMFKNNPGETLAKFKQDIERYKTTRAAWGWEDSDFEGFDKFLDGTVTDGNFEFGYGCSSMVESKPARPTFVKGISSISITAHITHYLESRQLYVFGSNLGLNIGLQYFTRTEILIKPSSCSHYRLLQFYRRIDDY